MNEGTGPPQLDARLAKAQQLIERGKHWRAIDELWEAEAQARGNADAICELIDFTTAFEQRAELQVKSGLVELAAALAHDIKMASQSRVVTFPTPTGNGSRSGGSLAAVWTLGLGVLGFFFGMVLGAATAQPCSPGDMVCFGPGTLALLFAVVFGLGGAGVGLVGSLLWLLGRAIARRRSRSRGLAG